MDPFELRPNPASSEDSVMPDDKPVHQSVNPLPLILGLRDAKQSPDRFDMSYWCKNPETGKKYAGVTQINLARNDCNTVMCLAGWASAYLTDNSDTEAVDWAVVRTVCGSNEAARNELRDLFQDVKADLIAVEEDVYSFVKKFAPKYLTQFNELLK